MAPLPRRRPGLDVGERETIAAVTISGGLTSAPVGLCDRRRTHRPVDQRRAPEAVGAARGREGGGSGRPGSCAAAGGAAAMSPLPEMRAAFADNEPGCIPLGEQRFPRLCHCPGGASGREHADCKASRSLLPLMRCESHTGADGAGRTNADETTEARLRLGNRAVTACALASAAWPRSRTMSKRSLCSPFCPGASAHGGPPGRLVISVALAVAWPVSRSGVAPVSAATDSQVPHAAAPAKGSWRLAC
jgi:hypothetical protein